jgi:hypothetical protein
MIPAKTAEVVGPGQMRASMTRPVDDFYALTGNDLNELAVLAIRLNNKFHDANELRDWQNRLNLMLAQAQKIDT